MLVGAFNQEKALVGALSVITNLRMELFEALLFTPSNLRSTFQTLIGQRTDTAAPNVESIINLQSKTTPRGRRRGVCCCCPDAPSRYIYNVREVISKLCLTVSDWPSSTSNSQSQYLSLYWEPYALITTLLYLISHISCTSKSFQTHSLKNCLQNSDGPRSPAIK